MMRHLLSLLAALLALAAPVSAQGDGPLRIEITEGVIEPLPYAVPDFVADGAGA
jgi:TolB protein